LLYTRDLIFENYCVLIMKQMEEHLAELSNCSTDSFFDESDCDMIPSSKLIK